ncbi:MAG: stage V sporulation T C-terminal domain-containing protein [Bacilli bacterium]|nr:stage V sporulation T C-terminal domain-containing protein [Bacilli bacterium]
MDAIGIIKRIDDLGRVLIPKEIRSNLRLNNGDNVELYIQNDSIVLKRYSIERKLEDLSSNFIYSINSITKNDIIITDCEYIIETSNKYKKYLKKKISDELSNYIKRRENILEKNMKELLVIEKESIECSYIIKSIMLYNDVVGLIIFLNKDKKLCDSDFTLASVITTFLNKYLEN